MKVLLIIPARFASTRLPGKPLALIGGLPMVVRVARQLQDVSGDKEVVIATDDERIVEAAAKHQIQAVMTGDHVSGTDRCAATASMLPLSADIVVNVQGDEPFIQASTIDRLIRAFDDPSVNIATLCFPIDREEDFRSEHVVKVVRDRSGNALYFSRAMIPFPRQASEQKAYKHIGIYAFRNEVLQQVASLPPTALERTESLEQLRWLEHGYLIRVVESDADTMGIDTPEDLAAANLKISE
ncbi:MAG TPA: 3-deoxy-manno-octulosonate cytidylyltransferase [Chitinophagales bacterium]|nr:3-deoxy-manno-octulosonate cytidylyltransferase [Chitinophagales bacterium]